MLGQESNTRQLDSMVGFTSMPQEGAKDTITRLSLMISMTKVGYGISNMRGSNPGSRAPTESLAQYGG